MRRAPSGGAAARALVLAGLWLAAAARPLALSDAGPHLHYGWGEPVRLRHLYATSAHGVSHCFLRIRADGAVDCERSQSAHSECRQAPCPHPTAPLAPGIPMLGHPGAGTRAQGPILPRQRRERRGGSRAGTGGTHVLRTPAGASCGFSFCLRPGLLEIRAVALRTVAFKGVHSSRYLCMGADGRMRGQVSVWRAGCAPRQLSGLLGSLCGDPRGAAGRVAPVSRAALRCQQPPGSDSGPPACLL